ncbi:crossover junction endodeoxyribonuclease RuvC [Prolixibacteraceae bacterium JC049]|nr:crossover junction endodeoxyribonuclease RuvC [Prolixibacteraceae bacterium JC049]
MGYGLIAVEGKETKLITMGVIHAKGYGTHYKKLQHLFNRVLHLVETYQPDEVALEAPFYGKNVQSMLKLGRAQGVAMAAALSRNKPIFEYAPLRVKQSITGMGRASKEQVAYFLQKIFKIEEMPQELDATDAIAVAVCHHLESSRPIKTAGYSGWKDFMKKNPDRIKQ